MKIPQADLGSLGVTILLGGSANKLTLLCSPAKCSTDIASRALLLASSDFRRWI